MLHKIEKRMNAEAAEKERRQQQRQRELKEKEAAHDDRDDSDDSDDDEEEEEGGEGNGGEVGGGGGGTGGKASSNRKNKKKKKKKKKVAASKEPKAEAAIDADTLDFLEIAAATNAFLKEEFGPFGDSGRTCDVSFVYENGAVERFTAADVRGNKNCSSATRQCIAVVPSSKVNRSSAEAEERRALARAKAKKPNTSGLKNLRAFVKRRSPLMSKKDADRLITSGRALVDGVAVDDPAFPFDDEAPAYVEITALCGKPMYVGDGGSGAQGSGGAGKGKAGGSKGKGKKAKKKGRRAN